MPPQAGDSLSVHFFSELCFPLYPRFRDRLVGDIWYRPNWARED